jgi:hypothetical protein
MMHTRNKVYGGVLLSSTSTRTFNEGQFALILLLADLHDDSKNGETR